MRTKILVQLGLSGAGPSEMLGVDTELVSPAPQKPAGMSLILVPGCRFLHLHLCLSSRAPIATSLDCSRGISLHLWWCLGDTAAILDSALRPQGLLISVSHLRIFRGLLGVTSDVLPGKLSVAIKPRMWLGW